MLTHGQMAFVVTNHLCDLLPGTTEQDASLVVAVDYASDHAAYETPHPQRELVRA